MKQHLLYLLLLPLAVAIAAGTQRPGVEPTIIFRQKDTTKILVTGTYWRLTELMGRSVGAAAANRKEVFIRFRPDGRMEGFAGCNDIGGNYELKGKDSIIITNVVGTLMACPQTETENSLVDILKTCDSYLLKDNQLVLNRARMASLARFEARKLP
ncbi:META domain-containing protein [Flavihumibacter petaseus]|uniref:DUF306 domain-containing protein n=1 Tax=Flavihumibacter petaseus NBRC 106054 TaxID=1220578 RepID=A0A0E9MY24_9BACT|nr:META domain-containing protein [Flavihumibacter petaseus]GAO42479.1 hypothetical protein FPE01S_01_14930 [Flavihumibacter petaseus NBRC 106054]